MSNPRGATVMIVSVIFVVLASICLFMRLYARVIVLKNYGWDEAAIFASYICSIILLVMTEEQVRNGMGEHFEVVLARNPEDFTNMLRYLWIAISFYNASLCLTKTSILLQYLRVFVSKGIRRACWATLAFIGAYGVFTILTNIFACLPVSAFWSPTGNERCINKKFSWFFNASINILTDLIIMILPMPTLKSLKLPLRQKIGLMIIFALGGFVCLVSILRLQSLYVISISTDPTYDNMGASMWSNIEVYTGIICASLPVVKPLIAKIFPNLLPSTRSGTAKSTFNGTFNDNGFGNNNARPIRLADIESGHKTVTRVEANERDNHNLRGSNSSGNLGKDIFITTSMTQDIESKFESRSQLGSEKDLIIQRP